ncbi:cytochrome c, partial [Vibrio sp. 10N.222.48.A8]
MSLNIKKFNPMATLSTLVMTLVMFPVSAEVNQEQFELGKQKAKVCMTCHG